MKYKVNKEKCIGCQACVANCPGATEMGGDGKAEIINEEKLEKCGGESVCPMGAIEKINGEEGLGQQNVPYEPGSGRGFGQGRGLGRGFRKGLGRGPRNGRGGGRGGGGRKI
jgi:ferredoxin